MDANQIITGISFGSMFATILGVVYWTSRTKVSKDTCEIVRENEKDEHAEIRTYIAAVETRAKERLKEFRDDLRDIKRKCNTVTTKKT